MIMGLAVHGKGDEALNLFNQMLVGLRKYSLCFYLPLLCL